MLREARAAQDQLRALGGGEAPGFDTVVRHSHNHPDPDKEEPVGVGCVGLSV